jgi:putative addiction module antidote
MSENIKMTSPLRITQIGNSLGVILPKEVLNQLKVTKGDSLFVSETPDGVLLSAFDPSFEEQVARGREFMDEYRDTFRTLAK